MLREIPVQIRPKLVASPTGSATASCTGPTTSTGGVYPDGDVIHPYRAGASTPLRRRHVRCPLPPQRRSTWVDIPTTVTVRHRRRRSRCGRRRASSSTTDVGRPTRPGACPGVWCPSPDGAHAVRRRERVGSGLVLRWDGLLRLVERELALRRTRTPAVAPRGRVPGTPEPGCVDLGRRRHRAVQTPDGIDGRHHDRLTDAGHVTVRRRVDDRRDVGRGPLAAARPRPVRRDPTTPPLPVPRRRRVGPTESGPVPSSASSTRPRPRRRRSSSCEPPSGAASAVSASRAPRRHGGEVGASDDAHGSDHRRAR